ncbi:MAG: Rrf2 family transcriptional regulator [Armatimonadota bacterium]|nr:Rrf2 family transcriptional regulator [Armatimonadota bacterium]
MNFTAKEDYGIRAIIDIAINRGDTPVQAKEIAARQGIPEQFLEQLLAALRRAGIIRSIRGAGGGYDLAKAASQITVGDILRTLSGPVVPIRCVNELDMDKCDRQGTCGLMDLWQRLKASISEVIDTTTIQDLVEAHQATHGMQSYMMNI